MRQQLLDAYWSVIRDGLFCTQAAERHGVNRGQLWKICKSSVIRDLLGGRLCFLFFKISILGSIQPKIVNRLESNDQKNMDLKTSFAINQICIIDKLCLISMSHQFA